MSPSSKDIIDRFRLSYGKDIDLTLRPAYLHLLEKLGNPQTRLPPVIHVAGTNGKGSTCAFMRAMLEAEGYKVHVYTSPHLISFHERIRIAGKLISEEELVALLEEVEKLSAEEGVSYFEAATAAAFAAFVRHPADYTILETGLGGRLDATNLVPNPIATIITRLSYDHRDFLGDTIEKIAGEKAGIMRPGVPCFTAPQPDAAALKVLIEKAAEIHAPLIIGGKDWSVDIGNMSFHYRDSTRSYELPLPALLGQHQCQNAGLAIAALSVLKKPLALESIERGLGSVEWPARLQRMTSPVLTTLVPTGSEIWLDGGHNDSAGEVLEAQIERWKAEDANTPRPLCVVIGMLTTKRPNEFLAPFVSNIAHIRTVAIPHKEAGYTAEALAEEAHKAGLSTAQPANSVKEALKDLGRQNFATPPRILICGSLYLAGAVLTEASCS